jgi:hypothetical protein
MCRTSRPIGATLLDRELQQLDTGVTVGHHANHAMTRQRAGCALERRAGIGHTVGVPTGKHAFDDLLSLGSTVTILPPRARTASIRPGFDQTWPPFAPVREGRPNKCGRTRGRAPHPSITRADPSS